MNTEDVFQQTQGIIREVTQCHAGVIIQRETQALQVRGWDSLSHTLLLLRIEEHFVVQLPVDRSLVLKNVGELVDLISEQLVLS